MSDNIPPRERAELRSVVKGQFKVLRAEVKRREAELKAEIESELLSRYRDEDEAIHQAKRDCQRALQEAVRKMEEIGDDLKSRFPDLEVQAGASRYGGIGIEASNAQRSQLHRALMASIPNKIGDASLALDRQEVDLLRKLSEGAIDSEDARGFLVTIPTVGELVPKARLREIEASLLSTGSDDE